MQPPSWVAYTDERLRLSLALYRLHCKSVFYYGTTPEGREHLVNGGTIGGPDGMSMSVGMKSEPCCTACKHGGTKDGPHWPCETVKLLLEAGVLVPLEVVEEWHPVA